MGDDEFIEMKVTGLTIDPFTNMPIIILKDLEEKSALPIWIGLIEASAIATELEKIELSRPMTHDLMKNIFKKLDVSVKKVEVNDLCDNTFYARIYLEKGSKEVVIDSRPSDAIAIALRTLTPIYVSKDVLDKAGIDNISTDMEVVEPNTSDKFTKEEAGETVLENLNEALERAITEEEYEVAARLRDRIKQLEKESTSQ